MSDPGGVDVAPDTDSPDTGSADGSVSGDHAEFPGQPLLFAPATADEKNTIRPNLAAVACWRLDDIRFDFDSSFVRPAADLISTC